jgi:hypothetical protein
MAQSTRRSITKSRPQPAEIADLSGLALVASAIGNIAQASSNKNLGREKEQLVAVLRDWRQAYQRLEERTRILRLAYEKVAAQVERLEAERQQWHTRFLVCERQLEGKR